MGLFRDFLELSCITSCYNSLYGISFVQNFYSSSSRRERHAKTMEVAQEEVVTCVGICLLERLQRLAQRLREEEQMVNMLQFASLQAMRRSFEMAVESKRGVSQVLLCQQQSSSNIVYSTVDISSFSSFFHTCIISV